MNYITSNSFDKQFSKLPKKLKKKALERFVLFVHNPFNQVLDNHPLMGKWTGYRSIDITGDMRAIFIAINTDSVYFVAVGSHSELYS